PTRAARCPSRRSQTPPQPSTSTTTTSTTPAGRPTSPSSYRLTCRAASTPYVCPWRTALETWGPSSPAGPPRHDIVFLASTFSSLAYANDHVAADPAVRDALAIGDEFVYPSQVE